MKKTTLALLITSISLSFVPKKEVQFTGLWKSIGYGRILDIQKSKVKTYDLNKVSCVPYYYLENLKDFKVESHPEFIHEDTIILTSGITKYKYFRIKELPKTCTGEPYSSARLHNFDSFWETFHSYYPYFKERNIDWTKIKEKYRSQINEQTSEVELLSIFKKINQELNDDHTNFTWIPDEIQTKYEETLKKEVNTENINGDSLWSIATNGVASTYLKKINHHNSNSMLWGITDNNLGYIQINRMIHFANYGFSSTLTGKEFWDKNFKYQKKSKSSYFQDNRDGVKQLMDSVMEKLKNTDGVIIDLRFNYGGWDQIALDILSYFNDSDKVVFTKKAKMGDTFTKPQEIVLKSQPNHYNKKVALLTGVETCSAAEIFVLASISLPQITRIGNNTSGHFSDAITKAIPIGWTFTMSMEVYLDQQNNNYEVTGIPPQTQTDTTSTFKSFMYNMLESEEDTSMIKAFELLKG